MESIRNVVREGGSIIVVGSGGSGKTYTVEKVLKEENIGNDKDKEQVIRINGLFCRDDSSAVNMLKQKLNDDTKVVIVDFAETFTNGRQTLLYRLFENAGKRRFAVIVITRDVLLREKLEKRVRSRFSGVVVFIPNRNTYNMKSGRLLAEQSLCERERQLLKSRNEYDDDSSVSSSSNNKSIMDTLLKERINQLNL